MKKVMMFILICLIITETKGQKRIAESNKVYRFIKKTEIPLLGGMWALNFLGMYKLNQKPVLDSAEVFALDKNDVWEFDRRVFSQTYPAPSNIYTISDIGLWISFVSPALLFLDQKIRKDWADITWISMYGVPYQPKGYALSYIMMKIQMISGLKKLQRIHFLAVMLR
jgi:hypothetical protein